MRVIVSAVGATSLSTLPVWLVGALAVQLRNELELSPQALGIAIACFFAAATVSSIRLGRTVEERGWRFGIRLSILLSALVSFAIGVVANSGIGIALLLAAAGVVGAITQPAANMALTRDIKGSRRGLAFGLKQAGVPMTTLFAGLAIPLIALSLGWRAVFLLAGLAALGFLPVIPGRNWRAHSEERTDDSGSPLSNIETQETTRSRNAETQTVSVPLIILTIAGGLGTAGASTLGAFLISFAVAEGFTEQSAGYLLAAGSTAGILARIGVGWFADRRANDGYILVALMMFGGAGCMIVLSGATSAVALVGGAIGAFMLGWSWNGVYAFAITATHLGQPASSTGVFMTALFLGGGIGPLLFGTLATNASYSTAWAISGLMLLLGAILTLVGSSLTVRSST